MSTTEISRSGLGLIADARRAALDGQFEDAARFASAALEHLPNCLVALRIQAWSQLELDDETALETFRLCAQCDPEDALARVGMAICYQQQGDTEAAIRAWTSAWELDPHNQSIRRALVQLTGELPESSFADAIALLRDGHYEAALELLREVRRERADAAVETALMSALWNAGHQREAFDLGLHVNARNPRNIKAALFIGALEDRAGRTLRSREAIARAEQADPRFILFADVVRQVGLQPAIDLHRGVAVARAR